MKEPVPQRPSHGAALTEHDADPEQDPRDERDLPMWHQERLF
jgi:hypothetical protein